MKKEIRKLTKTSSGSYNIVLPKEIVKKYKWSEKQKFEVEDKGRGIVQIRNWRKKK